MRAPGWPFANPYKTQSQEQRFSATLTSHLFLRRGASTSELNEVYPKLMHGNLPVQSAKPMKKKSRDEKTDDLRPEYDLRELLKGGIQGKYADRYEEGTNLVLLDHDVAEAFPTDEAVNEALRLVMQLTKLPRGKKETARKEGTSGSR